MAINAYILLNGIKGASQTKPDAVDILSANFDVSNSPSIQITSQEMKAGRAHVAPLSMSKASDKASPFLFLYCCTGKKIDDATLVYLKQDKGGKAVEYLKIKFVDVFIASYQIAGAGDDAHETFSIIGSKVTFSYNPEEKGDMKGFIDKTFNVVKNEES